MMKDADLTGSDYYVGCDNNTCTQGPEACQAACDADAPKCKAWTLVPNHKCCLKGSIPKIPTPMRAPS